MLIDFNCPHCGEPNRIPEHWAQHLRTCAKCHVRFLIADGQAVSPKARSLRRAGLIVGGLPIASAIMAFLLAWIPLLPIDVVLFVAGNVSYFLGMWFAYRLTFHLTGSIGRGLLSTLFVWPTMGLSLVLRAWLMQQSLGAKLITVPHFDGFMKEIMDAKKCMMYRLRLKGGNPVLPNTCVVTGAPTEETMPVRRFQWQLVRAVPLGGWGAIFMWRSWFEPLQLPFATAGYEAYTKSLPLYWRIMENGLAACMHVPLLPLDLMWSFAGPVCLSPILLLDAHHGRRRLCKVHWSLVWSTKREAEGDPTRVVPFVVTVSSEAFAQEFLRLNPETEMYVTEGISLGDDPALLAQQVA